LEMENLPDAVLNDLDFDNDEEQDDDDGVLDV
jgi:hypothetical protein